MWRLENEDKRRKNILKKIDLVLYSSGLIFSSYIFGILTELKDIETSLYNYINDIISMIGNTFGIIFLIVLLHAGFILALVIFKKKRLVIICLYLLSHFIVFCIFKLLSGDFGELNNTIRYISGMILLSTILFVGLMSIVTLITKLGILSDSYRSYSKCDICACSGKTIIELKTWHKEELNKCYRNNKKINDKDENEIKGNKLFKYYPFLCYLLFVSFLLFHIRPGS